LSIAIIDLFVGHAVPDPAAALVVVVLDEWHEAVQAIGEAGFWGFIILKFPPELVEFLPGFFGEKAEEPFCGFLLAFRFASLVAIAKGITSIDLDDVVNDEHLEDAELIKIWCDRRDEDGGS